MPDLHVTGDDEADRLLSENPLAFLIGMLLDSRVRMETAWAGPLKIAQRTGTMDAAQIAAMDPEQLAELFREKPAVHRFPAMMATAVHKLCIDIADNWNDDAASIWTEGDPNGAEVLKRLKTLPGFGPLKAKFTLAMLGKQYGYDGEGWRTASAPWGYEGEPKTVADVRSPEDIQAVRDYMKRQRRYRRPKK